MAGRWHLLAGDEVLEGFRTNASTGLDDRDIKERQERFGLNELAKAPPAPLWRILGDQFRDFMVLVLLAATLISALLGEYADAVTILIIVVVNAVLGCVQEYRAERSLEALKELASPEARVIRGGQEVKIPSSMLVPGDIVLLEAGDRVPADIRLLETSNMEVEESALTGESSPVKKNTQLMNAGGSGPGDHRNMAYLGTVVSRGRGRGVTVATGMATEMGVIAVMLQDAKQEDTPLQRRLGQMGKWLVGFCLAVCAAVVVLGVLRGEPLYYMFLAGVSLAVAAIPEGLPAIVTVALAIGVQRMIKRNVIIRKLPAVETLGCATVICSDKTGTLTQNKMEVRRLLAGSAMMEVSGEGYSPRGEITVVEGKAGSELELFMKTAALCSNALLSRNNVTVGGFFRNLAGGKRDPVWDIQGDPTEGALTVMAARGGYWRETLEQGENRIHENPFDSERKRMSVVYRDDQGNDNVYAKGAPDIILDLCTHYYKDGKRLPMFKDVKDSVLKENASMASQALRVLALAHRSVEAGVSDYGEGVVEAGLTFLGLAGMIDPPRPAAISAVHICKSAGIKVVMITGDHQLTARAVASEMGIMGRGGQCITGRHLDEMSDGELERTCEDVAVFARVSPGHKLRIVRAYKKCGHVVAMTGDGVNDAPAVKEADIGISMGITGTDVTREASSMVLTDDNFSSIVAAVEEGRGIYDNIRKFIRYLLSCNAGEVLVMFLAVLAGMPLPLVPIQILWMNLVTDGLPAMALGVDPADRDIMLRKPRDPGESIFSNGMGWSILGSGLAISLGTLLVFAGEYYWGSGNVDLSRTMAFNTLVFSQLFFVFNCRSEHHSLLEVGLFTNPHLVLAVMLSTFLQMAVNYIPFLQTVFHTVGLNLSQWGIVLLVAATPMLASIIYKHLRVRARNRVMFLKV